MTYAHLYKARKLPGLLPYVLGISTSIRPDDETITRIPVSGKIEARKIAAHMSAKPCNF